MKQLEDRIKDRLEGYESSLPEGDLAEFRAKLDKVDALSSNKVGSRDHGTPILAWLAPLAVAAGLGLFFVLDRDHGQDMVRVQEDNMLVADIVEPTVEIPEPTVEIPTPSDDLAEVFRPSSRDIDEVQPVQETAGIIEAGETGQSVEISEHQEVEPSVEIIEYQEIEQPVEVIGNQENKPSSESEDMSVTAITSPFVPGASDANGSPVSTKVGQAVAGVLGGTGGVALAGLVPSMLLAESDPDLPQDDFNDPGGINESSQDKRNGKDNHSFPLRAGLSLRIPFNDRWSLVTGLDYSLYSSSIGYSLTGGKRQNAHYLGVPLRMDYTIARNRWLDVYVGAGASADLCVAAYLDGSNCDRDGNKIEKDGLGFSLTGVGGLQFNITKAVGVFLDPTISWNIPSGNRVLETYRSEHPLMLSVSTGLRITIAK